MLALRSLPIAAVSGPFWFSALCAALVPTSIGYQDLAAFLARQPGISERWRDHLIASPFGTIHAAMFSFPHPIGTAMAEPIDAQTVNFDPRSLDVKVWTGNEPPQAQPALQVAYPTVNRRLKGNRITAPRRIAGVERRRQLAAIAADRSTVVAAAEPAGSGHERSAAKERRADQPSEC